MIELDVRELEDGTLVVMHDETVDRTTDGTGCVKNLTYEEIKQLTAGEDSVPTLDEVFARITADLDIELKVSEGSGCPSTNRTLLARSLVDTIHRNTHGRRVLVSSFDHQTLLEVRRFGPEIETGLLNNEEDIELAASFNFDAAHLNQSRMSADNISIIHRAALKAHAWTVNDEGMMQTLIENGIDMIITDYPDKAVSVLEAVCD